MKQANGNRSVAAELLGIGRTTLYSRTFRKDEKEMVQIKRDWFDTALKNYERGETHGRWKEKIQV